MKEKNNPANLKQTKDGVPSFWDAILFVK